LGADHFRVFLAAVELPFSLELLQASENEFLVVLRKDLSVTS
jgi:hypothetical protein